MSAGMPPSTASGGTTNKRWWMILGGTVAVLAVGGVAAQFWRAQPGSAAEESAGRASVGSPAKRSPGERAVAKVGKLVITEETLARACVSRHGKEVLDELINQALIQQACEKQRVKVTVEEVEHEIQKIAKKFSLTPDNWLQMLEAERDVSPQQYRQNVIWPMLALCKLAVEGAIDEVSDDDLQIEFERQYGERAKCRLIMLDNLRRAEDCWAKCKRDPESFDKFAQEYSIDPSSRSLGGTIPPIPQHSGNETIEKEAFKLNPGEISGVIEVSTPAGTRYAILKSEGKTEQVVGSLAEVQDQLAEELIERKTQESIAKVFQQIKDETSVHNYYTGATERTGWQRVNPAARALLRRSNRPGPSGRRAANGPFGPGRAPRLPELRPGSDHR